MTKFELIHSIVYGHAIADALGVPVEFSRRENLQRNPVTGMRAYGTYHMPAGTWSDDTTMALATMDSLAEEINYEDVMGRFADWVNNAAYTATDEVFDVGGTTGEAIRRFRRGTKAVNCGSRDDRSNGNGSLMRIYPIVLYCCLLHPEDHDDEAMADMVHNFSALTHAHPISKLGCGIYAFVLRALMNGHSIAEGLVEAKNFYKASEFSHVLPHYERIFADDFGSTPMDDIKSGGYVVDSLEAAVWCLLNSKSYAECALMAVNLGRDTDTVGAITGSLAAVLFGLDDMPQEWMDTLLNKELIDRVIANFAKNA